MQRQNLFGVFLFNCLRPQGIYNSIKFVEILLGARFDDKPRNNDRRHILLKVFSLNATLLMLLDGEFATNLI